MEGSRQEVEGVTMNERSITQQLQDIVDDVCQNYCKWPDIYDEEAEGVELCESSICQSCPLNRLV